MNTQPVAFVQEAGSKLIREAIQRTLAFAEDSWRPRLEAALHRVTDLEGELDGARRRHARFVSLAASRAKSDAEALRVQREMLSELEGLLTEFRSRLPKAEVPA
jgi:hypothetical protein